MKRSEVLETYGPEGPSGRLSSIQAFRGASVLGAAAVMCAALAGLRYANGDGGVAVWLVAAAVLGACAWLSLRLSDEIGDDRAWERIGDPGPLGRARAARRHREAEDPILVHTQYAAVLEGRTVVTYAFDVLKADDEPGAGAMLVMGRPRYQATVVAERRLPQDDPIGADAALDRAQEHAAELEREAAAPVRRAGPS